jgi:hypothetical protein
VDRRKKGSKHTLLVDRHGVPLAIRTAGANASDHRQIIRLVADFPKVTGKPGPWGGRPPTGRCRGRGRWWTDQLAWQARRPAPWGRSRRKRREYPWSRWRTPR